jgi:hypothetical protein
MKPWQIEALAAGIRRVLAAPSTSEDPTVSQLRYTSITAR